MKLERIVSLATDVIGLQFSDGIYHAEKALRIPRTKHPEDIELCRMEFDLLAKNAAISIALMKLEVDGLIDAAEKMRPDLFKKLAG